MYHQVPFHLTSQCNAKCTGKLDASITVVLWKYTINLPSPWHYSENGTFVEVLDDVQEILVKITRMGFSETIR